ncbi:cupin domain-containing protein [Bacteroides sp. AN502(2024)]|uniref:cupin domain-containing protein n=1 Tax=Bacteroides sp. AN502(2024) TaxID=3160599 RepID=UPI0035127DF9
MKYLLFLLAFSAVILSSCSGNTQQPVEIGAVANDSTTLIFPMGLKASAEKFIGTAYVNELLPKSDSTAYAVADVVFEPGARNNWHTHQVRQTMFVTAGHGWYQERGKKAVPLKKGDVYVIPAGVEHWHGAAADSRFVHLVVTDFQGEECVIWGEPVTDEEYNNL